MSKRLHFANHTALCNRIKQQTILRQLRSSAKPLYAAYMATLPQSSIAVMFIAQRTADDEAGYADAAAAMVALAEQQPGYRGTDSTRGADGLGITISYRASDTDAKAWRDHCEHALIRDTGRDRWYAHYSLHVGEITRSYDWQKR